MHDKQLLAAMRAIVADDRAAFTRLLAAESAIPTAALATGASRQQTATYFFDAIKHYVYAGDTALHVAAAALRSALARTLLKAGANVHAKNRRGAEPLHYAVDGGPGNAAWDPAAQVATIEALLAAGADPNATDKGGVTPLHRAVRNRCADAVRALLAGGADRSRANNNGSKPLQLAKLTTGRGGTGSADAKAQQAEIVRLLSAGPPR
jgi:hypothetical protein